MDEAYFCSVKLPVDENYWISLKVLLFSPIEPSYLKIILYKKFNRKYVMKYDLLNTFKDI